MSESRYKSNLNTDEKVLIAVVRTAEIFKRAHGSVFRKYGLSFPQYNVLRVLETSVNRQNKISDVSRIMLAPVANMTGLVKRLEKGGFITRKSDPSDERVTLLKMTAKGRMSLQKIEKEKDDWLERLLKGFSKDERLELLQMVKRLIKNNMMTV